MKTKTIDAAARIAGRSSGRVISPRHPPRRRAERGRRRLQVAGEVLPHRADGAHDDGEVERDVGGEDRPDAPLDRRGEQGEHGRAHHDGRQHEHRGEQPGQQAPRREAVAGHHVGRQEPGGDGEGGAGGGLPEREPGDLPRRRARAARAVEAAREQGRDRPDVERHQERDRRGREGDQHPPWQPVLGGFRLDRWHRSHPDPGPGTNPAQMGESAQDEVGPLVDPGLPVGGDRGRVERRRVGGLHGVLGELGRQGDVAVGRVHEQVERRPRTGSAREIRKSTSCSASSGASVPRRTPANSTWRKHVDSTTAVGASVTGGSANSTSAGGLVP